MYKPVRDLPVNHGRVDHPHRTETEASEVSVPEPLESGWQHLLAVGDERPTDHVAVMSEN